MEPTEKKTTPPYVAYKTLKNFLEKFQQGTPGRIERGLMGNLSGAVQSQLTTALKYLHLISDNNIPSDDMKRLVVAQGAEQTKLMKDIITRHYPFIFSPDFDFTTATGTMLHERFEQSTGASGETVNRCIAFLKEAAQDVGIPVSPFLSHKTGGAGGVRKKTPQTARKNDKTTEQTPPAGDTSQNMQTPRIEAQNSLLLWGLFQRLPKPGSPWPKQDREQWTQTLNNVLTLEYPEN